MWFLNRCLCATYSLNVVLDGDGDASDEILKIKRKKRWGKMQAPPSLCGSDGGRVLLLLVPEVYKPILTQ